MGKDARSIANEIHGTDAGNIFQNKPYASFCSGSDRLQALGLWDCDGSPIDWQLNADVTKELQLIDLSISVGF